MTAIEATVSDQSVRRLLGFIGRDFIADQPSEQCAGCISYSSTAGGFCVAMLVDLGQLPHT